jgi:hypothetical protein
MPRRRIHCSLGLFQFGGVGGNITSGMRRNRCAVFPSRPRSSTVNGMDEIVAIVAGLLFTCFLSV